jgi:carbon-monoxide dehydrogenase medium subunit
VKPARFVHHAPRTTDEAVQLLSTFGDDARALAGGQAMMPLLARRELRAPVLVDLNRVTGLDAVTGDGTVLRVGALTRVRRLERDPLVGGCLPALARAGALSGPVPVRNRATVGGALAHADPAAELSATAVALDARIELRGARVRRLPAEQFFLGPHRTALDPDELVVAVEYPVPPRPTGFGVAEVAARSTDPALAGAVVVLRAGGERLVVFGAVPTPVRASEAEAALARGDSAREVAEAALCGVDPAEGDGLSAETRRMLVRAVVERAVTSARDVAA